MVVSDDPRVRDEVVGTFPSDVDVRLADDAREAWDVMEDIVPGAVVVDMRTGNAGGFALAKDMSQLARLASVPVVILLERPQDEWLAKTAGAAIVRTKPITSEQLVRDVVSLLPSASN